MRHLLLAGVLLLAGCASPFVLLVNPKNGTTVECSGMAAGAIPAAIVRNQVDNCVKQYEGLGYVKADNLTDAQRSEIDIKAPEKQHRAVHIKPPPIIVPSIAPALNCTSNRIGDMTTTRCN